METTAEKTESKNPSKSSVTHAEVTASKKLPVSKVAVMIGFSKTLNHAAIHPAAPVGKWPGRVWDCQSKSPVAIRQRKETALRRILNMGTFVAKLTPLEFKSMVSKRTARE